MKEISLHIMDIVQNSITASAALISVALVVSAKDDLLSVSIEDNGSGMDAELLQNVTSPFTTTRTTRKVGLGISLFAAGAEATGGSFTIESTVGEGTNVKAVYRLDHVDRPPIGDFAGTIHTLIISNPDLDFLITVQLNGEEGILDTREIRKALGGNIPLDLPDVSLWIKENLDFIFPEAYADF